MEDSERPNKIRKLSHDRPETARAPESLSTAAPAQELLDPLPTSLPSTADGATKSDAPAAVEQEADEASKTVTPGPNTQENVDTITTQAASLPQPDLTGTGYTPILDPSDPSKPLSKNQQKKLRRQQQWDAKKDDRRVMRKEKFKEKRERKRAERDALGPEFQPGTEEWKEMQRTKQKKINPVQLPITLLIDCDFDDKMRDNERVSLAGQITRSYSENKNARLRTHLSVCSFQGKLRERFDGVLAKNYLSWKGMRFLDEDFVVAADKAKEWMANPQSGGKLKSVFEKYAATPEDEEKARQEGEVIYLSSDSDYTLTELKPYSTYIIGGLVDKNREKGICHRRAVEKGVKTARLPIGDYLDMASRKVLATNHVVEIMLRWLELGDWGEAFMKVIPKRKGGTLKGQEEDGDDNQDDGREAGENEDEDGAHANEDAATCADNVQPDTAVEAREVTMDEAGPEQSGQGSVEQK